MYGICMRITTIYQVNNTKVIIMTLTINSTYDTLVCKSKCVYISQKKVNKLLSI